MGFGSGNHGCGTGFTWEVGQKPNGVSPYGAHDMAGNVWEWTSSWFSSNQSSRVLRGGAFFHGESILRSSDLGSFPPDFLYEGNGFRCAACTPGFTGPDCAYSDAGTCNGNGAVASDSTCTCDTGWYGVDCSTDTAAVLGEACNENADCESGRCSVGSICAPADMPADMTYVPAGEFIYGPDGSTETLTTGGYYIDIYEVTAGSYKTCVDAGACSYAATGSEWGYANYHTYNNSKDNHPIIYVNWQEAVDYCSWKRRRLPTEFEWEKAARGTDGRTYPWGDETPTCNYAVMRWEGYGCGTSSTWEVGQKPNGVSPYGTHDMVGNVWEWTSSWYSSNQSYRVLRGGSFDYGVNWLRSSYRYSGVNPDYRNDYYGFRCAQ